MNIEDPQNSICGEDLEQWRIENGLTQVAAAHAFGLQMTKWAELTRAKRDEPLVDPVLAMLLYIYKTYPDSSPVKTSEEVKNFFCEHLGLKDTTENRERFATLIGRSVPSVYRLLSHHGKPGMPVVRWMEALLRLKLTPQKRLRLMMRVANNIVPHQAIEDEEDVKFEASVK